MDTAYNTNTTTVQESRNRYNALLAQALERIKARKTAQEPEEVTTTEPTATTPAQQSEPVATPENVTTEPTEASKPQQVTTTRKTTTTRRTKTASPKPLGRDIYHIFTEKQSKWALLFDKSVYHAPEGCAVLSDNVILIESKLDYREEYSGKMILEDGSESKKDSQLIARYQKVYQSTGDKYAITPKEIEEQIKAIQDEETHTALCELFGKDMTPEEVKEELKYNKEARAYVNERTARHQTIKLLLPAGDFIHLAPKNLKTALKVAKTLATTCISNVKNILQFTGEAGKIILAGYIIRQEDENSMHPLIIDLADATPAPEDTTAIEEAPATAPRQTEEDTTTVPEATAPADTEEEEMRKRREADNITVLKYCVEHYGEVGADYLDTLDYNQATEQVYSTKRGNSTKVTERFYSIEGRTIYGLHRRYNKNGKRAKFVVFKDGQIIEERTYGKNNNCYKVKMEQLPNERGRIVRYQVEDGKVIRAEYLLKEDDKKPLTVVFDDSNRPETPRDLPAPAPTKATSKETTKGTPATTVQKQPTSKTATAPTPEATTDPEEVTTVTTSKQEDDTTPYWLLLDNELRAQQEEQEQETTPATPEKSEEEPMHAPQMLKKIIEEQKRRAAEGTNTIPLKTAVGMTTEVLTKKRAKELLGDDASDYNTYILVDGTHIVETDRPELSTVLYIDDESKEYKEYQRGNISAVKLYRDDMMSLYSPASSLEAVRCSPSSLRVIRTSNNLLRFERYGGRRYGDQQATPDEVEIYKAALRASHEAFSKRLDSYIRRYGKKIYVSAYWANR